MYGVGSLEEKGLPGGVGFEGGEQGREPRERR